jgi:hypothetical protein
MVCEVIHGAHEWIGLANHDQMKALHWAAVWKQPTHHDAGKLFAEYFSITIDVNFSDKLFNFLLTQSLS